ncbi:MAG: hypothetical protein AAFN12_08790 [Cyanobacteria bacterium J06560_2]
MNSKTRLLKVISDRNGDGQDTLNGGSGRDECIGGRGADYLKGAADTNKVLAILTGIDTPTLSANHFV